MAPPIELSISSDDTKIAALLLHKKLLTEGQLKAALDYQRSVGGRIIDIVLKLDLARPSQLEDVVERVERGDAVSSHVDLESVLDPTTVNLSELKVHRRLLEKLPAEIAEKYQVVLFFPCARVSSRKILFGHGLPTPPEVIEKARTILGVDLCSLALDHDVVRGYLGEARADAPRKPAREERVSPSEAPRPTEGAAPTEVTGPISDVTILNAVVTILLRKGLVTKDELQAELERPRPKS